MPRTIFKGGEKQRVEMALQLFGMHK
jgi:hypothetical protein